MFIIGQVNEFTPFTETGNFRLFPPSMMQIVRHVVVCIYTERNKSSSFYNDYIFYNLEQLSH